MQKRACGESGLKLPVLGIGAWSFGGGKYWGAQDQSDVDSIVHRALEKGCNYFDTAEMYNDGDSERSLGKALKGRRAEALIGTKVLPLHARRAALRRHCDASLQRLDTDYIDLYMMHWPINFLSLRQFDRSLPNDAELPQVAEAFAALQELQREGKIRHIGISNFGVAQMKEVLATGATIAVNQLAYNLLTRAIEFEILPFCHAQHIGVMAYTPLMQGLLTGKFKSLADIPPQRMRTRHFSSERAGTRHGEPGFEREIAATLMSLNSLAQRQHVSLGHLALGWLAAQPGMTCILAGARNIAQLDDNIAALELAMDADLQESVASATQKLKEGLGPNADPWENNQNKRIW